MIAIPLIFLLVLRAAAESGATTLVLCDTNGGTLPSELRAIVGRTVEEFREMPHVEVGIHTHNDSEVVDESRAEELFVTSLGDDGREWLSQREDF